MHRAEATSPGPFLLKRINKQERKASSLFPKPSTSFNKETHQVTWTHIFQEEIRRKITEFVDELQRTLPHSRKQCEHSKKIEVVEN